jgi:hypothetical protein
MNKKHKMSRKMGNSYWSVWRNVAAHVSEIEIDQQINNVEHADIDMESTGFSTIANVLDQTIYDDNKSIEPEFSEVEQSCPIYDMLADSTDSWDFNGEDIVISDDSDSDDVYDFLDCDSLSESDTLSENDSDKDDCDDDLPCKLAECIVEFNVSHAFTAALLHILRPYHPKLPKDPRTLLSTPSKVNVVALAGGNYHHVGIEHSVTKLVERYHIEADCLNNIIYIQINIDGLPLYKSTGLQLWPILGMLKEPDVKEPFIIGIYAGKKKPFSVSDYLSQFVSEAKKLETEGIMLLGKKVLVQIHSFVCDAPARSFIKQTKSFTGYYGCDRCIQEGQYVSDRMTYPEINAIKRTDVGFANKIYDEHHLSDVPSPLASLSVGLVSTFVLDYMHLVCLGVVRRMIVTWLRGPLSSRLPARRVVELSTALEKLRFYTPSDFSRKPRGFCDIDHWKATELRQFLLFTSPIVLRDFLPEALYNHFMLLHVAITCLVSKSMYGSMCNFAEKLLKTFVQHGRKLYGPQFLVYNVHCLIHLADDVRHFGPLDGISCFPFENHLGKIKRTVRRPANPLQQVVNRLAEQQTSTLESQHTPVHVLKGVVDVSHCTASNSVCYSSLHTQHLILSSRIADSCVMLPDRKVGRIQYFYEENSTVFVAVRLFVHMESFYNYPLSSEDIGIFCVGTLNGSTCTVPLTDVVTKCFCMPMERDKFLVVPLHH